MKITKKQLQTIVENALKEQTDMEYVPISQKLEQIKHLFKQLDNYDINLGPRVFEQHSLLREFQDGIRKARRAVAMQLSYLEDLSEREEW